MSPSDFPLLSIDCFLTIGVYSARDRIFANAFSRVIDASLRNGRENAAVGGSDLLFCKISRWREDPTAYFFRIFYCQLKGLTGNASTLSTTHDRGSIHRETRPGVA